MCCWHGHGHVMDPNLRPIGNNRKSLPLPPQGEAHRDGKAFLRSPSMSVDRMRTRSPPWHLLPFTVWRLLPYRERSCWDELNLTLWSSCMSSPCLLVQLCAKSPLCSTLYNKHSELLGCWVCPWDSPAHPTPAVCVCLCKFVFSYSLAASVRSIHAGG